MLEPSSSALCILITAAVMSPGNATATTAYVARVGSVPISHVTSVFVTLRDGSRHMYQQVVGFMITQIMDRIIIYLAQLVFLLISCGIVNFEDSMYSV